MTRMMMRLKPVLAALPLCLAASALDAHPHVFAEARLAVTVGADGAIQSLSHVWRFDDVFSDTVKFEFDKDADGKMSPAELAEISKTIVESIGDYNYFESVSYNGKDMKMAKPADLTASFDGSVLVISFSNKPADTMQIVGKMSFGIYDPTFYTSIEFVEDTDMSIAGLPPACKTEVVRPDPDQALAQNQGSLTEAFFNDPKGTDMAKIFATRLDVQCG